MDNIGSRKVVDDSDDDDEVIETKPPAPKPKTSNQQYAPNASIVLGYSLLTAQLKEARSSQRRTDNELRLLCLQQEEGATCEGG